MDNSFEYSTVPAGDKFVDDNAKADSGAKPGSNLDRLRTALAKKVERPRVILPIPERDGVALIISPNITQENFKKWNKIAGEGTKKDGVDNLHFACLVIAHTTVGISFDGEEQTDEFGHPYNFATPEVKALLDVSSPIPQGVRAMFGIDAHVFAAASAVLDAAGYGDTVETVDEDPLKSS